MSQVIEKPATDSWPNLPAADAFPQWPASWYLFGRSRDIGNCPQSKTIMGRRIVAFRSSDKRIAVMDARCAHLGADLGRGRVVGDTICCPYHHWQYAPNGRCVSVPQADCVPDTAQLRTYPSVERHGLIYFFFGKRPLFPLPFYSDCDPADFSASKPFQFHADCPWFMLVCNGFDTQHFHAVHERRPVSKPTADCPAPLARRMQFHAEIVGTSIFDRLLRRFVGKEVHISITSWGGPYVLVEGIFPKAHSRLLVASRPLDASNTHSDVIAFARKSSHRLVDQINLSIRRRFTRAFVQYDIDKLSGIRYQPEGLTEGDRELAQFFLWVATLPLSEYEDGRS